MNVSCGILRGIAVKSARRQPMAIRTSVGVTNEAGLDGDYRGGTRRQVTILSLEDWLEAAAETGNPDLPWTIRRRKH